MKGMIKGIKRAPQMMGSKVGFSSKSNDAESDELVRKFAGLEDYTAKLVKDTTTFRDGISTMITSQAGFATAFNTVFQPMGAEASLSSKYPEAATTLQNIASYQENMAELRDAIQPELELIESRVVGPLKEYTDLLKRIRKTITKREHKLVDYDRHNNSYTKLKDKKEKSLNDEKNLFKIEQDLEQATQEYEHYNNLLKTEVPHFLQLTTAFISPIFQTFYFIKIGILYTLLEKLQGWAGQTYGSLGMEGLEEMYQERLGDTIAQLEELTVTKRFVSTAKMMSQHRAGSETSSIRSGSTIGTGLGRSSSVASSAYKSPPPVRANSSSSAAPPPYSSGSAVGTASSLAGKRAPPPPPASRPKPGAATTYVTALYDYAATAEGDLSFAAGDRIELVKKTESAEDWWTGRLNGTEGVFPGNYVQL